MMGVHQHPINMAMVHLSGWHLKLLTHQNKLEVTILHLMSGRCDMLMLYQVNYAKNMRIICI